VLTRSYLGILVPQMTGRRVFVGDCLWSQPGCWDRVHASQDLFDAAIPAATARRFVRQTGASFLLADCTASPNLPQLLGPVISATRTFGCARVYTVANPGPLAESGGDAAFRAARRQ
jgi:hypothetical protein